MKTYHFSSKFIGSDWMFHGVFVTSFTDQSDIVRLAKIVVSQKLEAWHKQAKDMIFFDVYYFDDTGKEINVFKYVA